VFRKELKGSNPFLGAYPYLFLYAIQNKLKEGILNLIKRLVLRDE